LGGQSSNAVCGALESAQAGVTHGLARISIGIEHWRDLLDDFEQALTVPSGDSERPAEMG